MRNNIKELIDYSVLRGKHKGETAFVVGSGTSVADLDLSGIHNHVVVTVNAGILLMPSYWQEGTSEKRYWLSNDMNCLQWDWWPLVQSAQATRLVRDCWHKYFSQIPDLYQFSPRSSDYHINIEENGLASCSSIPTAIDLALQMGCSKVYLLGVDQYQKGNASYFWQVWNGRVPRRIDGGKETLWRHQTRLFDDNNKAYPELVRFAHSLGAEIVNCNPQSCVDAFSKIAYEEIIYK